MSQTVEEYIKNFPENVTQKLETIRSIIKEIAPEAEERISYKMPAYFLNGSLVYFAAWEKHIALYPVTAAAEKALKKELAQYDRSGRGTVRFPLDKPLPTDFIRKFVKQRLKENMEEKK